MAKPKRKRPPAAKKALDYKKQRRGFSEYSKALRGGKWRRNKRRPAQQAVRQAERVAVGAPSAEELADPGFDPGVIARPKIGKWGAIALADWVPKQKARRVPAITQRKARRR